MHQIKEIDARHPDWFPLLVLLIIGIGFFFPVFFLGRAPAINSLRTFEPWRGEWIKRGDATVEVLPNGAPEYSFINNEGFADDLNRQFIPWGLYAQKRLQAGELPLWNPHLACGQPLFANHQTGLTNPLILFCYLLFPGISAFTAIFFSIFVLSGWGMYAYLRIIGLSRESALLASVSYQLMLGYIPVLDTLIVEKALFPFLLYAIERIFRTSPEKSSLWIFISILLLALVQTSSHAQEAVFISYLLAPYIILIAGSENSYRKGIIWKTIGKRSILTFGIFASALLISLVQNLPTLEFYQNSTRAALFSEQIKEATQLEEQLTWIQSLMLAFPRLFGDYLVPKYYLEHYLLNYGYVGIMTLTAGLFAGWIKPSRRQVWFWRIAAAIFFLSIISNWFYFEILCQLPLFRVSLQKPFSPLFFSLIILGGHGFEFLLDPKEKKSNQNKWLGRITLIIFASAISLLILWILQILYMTGSHRDEYIYVFGQLFLGLATASAGFFFVALFWRRASWAKFENEKILTGKILAFSGLLIVILLDLFPVKAHFNPFVARKDLFFETELTRFLQENLRWEEGNPDGPYRFGRSWKEILPPNTGMMYGLEDFGGYDSNLVGRYGLLLDSIDTTILEGVHYIETPRKRPAFSSKVWNMLGVKYVAAHPGHSGQFEPLHRWVNVKLIGENEPGTNTGAYSGDILVVKNNEALPRMILVDNVIACSSDEEALKRTLEIDPSSEAVVIRQTIPEMMEQNPSFETGSLGSVTITRYEPEIVTAKVFLSKPALLCFFDTYFPGWNVSVNNMPAELEIVNYAFKGVFLPKGNHVVTFTYKPLSLKIGAIITMIGFILALLVSRIFGKTELLSA